MKSRYTLRIRPKVPEDGFTRNLKAAVCIAEVNQL